MSTWMGLLVVLVLLLPTYKPPPSVFPLSITNISIYSLYLSLCQLPKSKLNNKKDKTLNFIQSYSIYIPLFSMHMTIGGVAFGLPCSLSFSTRFLSLSKRPSFSSVSSCFGFWVFLNWRDFDSGIGSCTV